MSSEEKRYTAEEWRQIQEQSREQINRGVRAMYPLEEGALLPFGPHPDPRGPQDHRRPAPHVENWFTTLSPDDITRLEALMALRSETVKWVAEKNPRELQKLDDSVDFISSTRTAAKVLMYVSGVAVAFLGGVVALAKSGFDAFALIRGGK